MSIQIRKWYVPIQSITGNVIEPEYMDWKKDDIEEYLKEHPMPEDKNYSKEDLMSDLTDSSGSLTFSSDLKEETIEYLSDLMNWLTYDKKRLT